jgi:3-oxoacyl-[acyl-carrier protein] reductase
VNAIAPAGIKSDMWLSNSWRYAPGCNQESSLEEIEAALANGSPLKRCGVPADIGRIVAFLSSPAGEWINGMCGMRTAPSPPRVTVLTRIGQILPCNGGANI